MSSDGGFIEAQVIDFSDHGIALWICEPFRSGEQFILKIKLERMTLLVYTAQNCVPDGGSYRVGAVFGGIVGSPDDDAEMLRARFIAHLDAVASQEVPVLA